MTYKESITQAMTDLAADPAVCFIGYGIRYGKAMGTLKNVSEDQLIETPVAENLMVGLAIGLSLRGKKPVVFIERADFLLNALDAIVNHLTKIELMSRGQFKPSAILRIIVGNKTKPLFTGETHTQDFRDELHMLANHPGQRPFASAEITHGEFAASTFEQAHEGLEHGHSSAIWEYKDLY